MKKKIIICAFSLLILVTAIIFIAGAIYSYNYDMKYYSEDKWVGFGAVVSIMVGGFFVFYELDLFYTVYYFFIKPRTKTKSILNVLSNLTLLLIFFSDDLAHILYIHLNIFKEDWLLPITLFFIYISLRIVYIIVSKISSIKETKNMPVEPVQEA